MPPPAALADRLAAVRRRLETAALRAHRDPRRIQLVAVSKTFSAAAVREAAAAGQRAFGENRVQEGLEKLGQLADLGLEWHLIGHLQSNKARKAVAFAWIQSLDRLELVARLDAAAADLGVRPRVLVQVDLAQETTKHGARAEGVRALVDAVLSARALDLRGLMVIPPPPETPEDSRPWFRRLRELRDELVAGGVPGDRLAELSMGMSDDFEVAIEEGATIVRVGSAIFGARPALHTP
jgi:pyridoxal phosphate enzyme (YggS family)